MSQETAKMGGATSGDGGARGHGEAQAGLCCPMCETTGSTVVLMEAVLGGLGLRRRRRCQRCGGEWTTVEAQERAVPPVVADIGAAVVTWLREHGPELLAVAQVRDLVPRAGKARTCEAPGCYETFIEAIPGQVHCGRCTDRLLAKGRPETLAGRLAQAVASGEPFEIALDTKRGRAEAFGRLRERLEKLAPVDMPHRHAPGFEVGDKHPDTQPPPSTATGVRQVERNAAELLNQRTVVMDQTRVRKCRVCGELVPWDQCLDGACEKCQAARPPEPDKWEDQAQGGEKAELTPVQREAGYIQGVEITDQLPSGADQSQAMANLGRRRAAPVETAAMMRTRKALADRPRKELAELGPKKPDLAELTRDLPAGDDDPREGYVWVPFTDRGYAQVGRRFRWRAGRARRVALIAELEDGGRMRFRGMGVSFDTAPVKWRHQAAEVEVPR